MPRFVRSKCACGNLRESKGRVDGKQVYGTLCSTCRKNRKRGLHYLKKRECEICGFISQHPSQIDIDHIDGNHFNNDPSNLQSLCANCHRLKTITNRDHLSFMNKSDTNKNEEEQCQVS